MGGSDSPIGTKLRIRLKAENSEAEIGLKHKKRKKYVSFNSGNIETASEDSKVSLLIECNPPSLRRVEFAEVLNIKLNQSIDHKEDTVDLMSEESVENEYTLDYLDNLELEAKRIIEKNGLKGKFDNNMSKQNIENKDFKNNVINLTDNDLTVVNNAECYEENKTSHGSQESRNQVITNNRISSPIYNNLSQINNQTILPPQPIQIAPNVVQQPLRTFANSLLLSKEKFSTRSFTPLDPNSNSSLLLKVQLPESINQLYSSESIAHEDIKQSSETDEADKKIPIVIPTCSEWFDMDSVHPIELEMLSPIFNNEIVDLRTDEKQDHKTEISGKNNKNFLEERITSPNDEKISEYKLIRNKIIEIYRETPRQYLTVTECRRRIIYTGDVSFLLKLHAYLEFWGLINFQANIKTLPPKLRKFRDYRLNDLDIKRTNNNSAPNISRINDEAINNPFVNSMLVQCVSCGKSCIYSYYILRAGVVCGVSVAVLDRCVWCIRCYSEGRYPPILNSGHFIKVDAPIVSSLTNPEEIPRMGVLGIASWTKEEVQKLIEGVEYYGDDWDAISYHLGNTKTPQECVAYFIQLPIEEPFMRNINPSKHTKPSFPFMDVSNPLMTQIALIASTVNPVVAASAAKSALDRILEIEGYKEKISDNQPFLSNKNTLIVGDEAAENNCVGSNFNDKANQYLPQFIPKISSANWPSSALLGEKGIQQVCSKALENAALRAKELAEWERNEVENIIPYLIDNTINRLELKLRQFRHLQSMIDEERNFLEVKIEKIKKENDEIKSKLSNAKSQVISKQTLRL
ncbi:RSC8 with a swirm domain [Cryptosporidium sp. chipmunk genotype I]|uniref:RSC8 with a swirm domain n=1 Tax=Cryptosporidium sp. chipmunk genotype I TaxID=1280935 RepID=UPI003519DCB2|nr:RSC8 with a swirm domain [Cryptosporidium sp. chipmunk genotype I]